MFTRSESIPLNIHDQADHWKRNYNRLHHVDFTVEEFVLRVNQLETMTAGSYIDTLYIHVLNICTNETMIMYRLNDAHDHERRAFSREICSYVAMYHMKNTVLWHDT